MAWAVGLMTLGILLVVHLAAWSRMGINSPPRFDKVKDGRRVHEVVQSVPLSGGSAADPAFCGPAKILLTMAKQHNIHSNTRYMALLRKEPKPEAPEKWEAQLRKGCLELAILACLWEKRLYG